jgi:gliding motility-associated-like protein
MKYFVLLLLIFFGKVLLGQNLVPDPGFEIRTVADSSLTVIDTGITAINLNVFYQSPKLLTHWSVPSFATSGIRDIRNSPNGTWQGNNQTPYEGSIMGYIRIYNYATNQFGTFAESRSYLQTQLSDSLKAGNLYKVSFFVQMVINNAAPFRSVFASSSIGIHLSNNRLTQFVRPFKGDSTVINVIPQITNHPDSFYSDTTKWYKICGLYRALGGEQWLTVGNFYDDANTKLRLIRQGLPSTIGDDDSHYFIDNFSVEEVKLIQPTIKTRDTVVCANVPFSKTLRATKGASSYLWSNNSTADSLMVTTPGKYWLNADFGCGIESDTFTIRTFPLLPLELGSNQAVCSGTDSVLLTAPLGFSSYRWSNGDTSNQTWVKNSGSYSIIASYPCDTLKDTVSVTFYPIPPPPLVADTGFCKDSLVQLVAFGQNLLWYDSLLDPNAKPTAPLVSNSAVGNKTYFVSQTINGCESPLASFSVQTDSLLSINLGSNQNLCNKDSIILGVNFVDNRTYQWNTGENTPQITVKSSGNYWLESSNVCNTSSDTVAVAFNKSPTPPLVANFSFCNPTPISLSDLNVSGNNLLWYENLSSNQGVSQPVFPSPQTDGTVAFFVTQTINNCESEKATFEVEFISPPIIRFGRDTSICKGETLTLSAPTNATSFTWSHNSSKRTIVVDSAGIYSLTVANFCGTDSNTINISIIDCSTSIDIPTIFTPNNDGVNDIFLPYGKNYTIQDISIFNRWGQRIFNGRSAWDGRVLGENASDGIYFYIITITDANNKIQVFKGSLSLVR